MAPFEALQNDIFIRFAWIVGGLLAVGGVALLGIRFGLGKNVRSIWLTYRGWLIMAPAAFGMILLGREAIIIGGVALSLMAFIEYARATGLRKDRWMTGAVCLWIVALAVTLFVSHPEGREGHEGWYGLFMTMPVYMVSFLLFIPIFRNRCEGQLRAIALGMLGGIYIGWMFMHWPFLANSKNACGYLLFTLLAVGVNDIAAFTFGKLFGKHPLRSNVSPNKTWEGSIGALAVSMAMPWALGFALPGFTPWQKILTGLIVGIGGQLGDLTISVIKRDVGVKDMGVLIPGHGGILDRIDSLIYVAPLFFHMVDYFHGI
jgi:phosphatidate cytidylyltransferase